MSEGNVEVWKYGNVRVLETPDIFFPAPTFNQPISFIDSL